MGSSMMDSLGWPYDSSDCLSYIYCIEFFLYILDLARHIIFSLK